MKFDYKPNHYKPNYFCGILPNANESRHEFKIGSNLPNIEDKFGKQGEGMNKGPDISTMLSTEGGTQEHYKN